MQHEIRRAHDLLDAKGELIEAGWAREALLRYNRSAIQKAQDQIREWEYYLALHKDFALGISIANVGPSSRLSLHFMDFVRGRSLSKSHVTANSADWSLAMPQDVRGDVVYEREAYRGQYLKGQAETLIQVSFPDFDGDKTLRVQLRLELPDTDKMVIVVPYEDPELFYYNYKVNAIPVSGEMSLGEERFVFDKDRSVATNDWGRGIWEAHNQWYWASLSCRIHGQPFAFNIGHGFGDDRAATENVIFYAGMAHKLDQVTFHISGDVPGALDLELPAENYMQNWHFTSNDGRLNLLFEPLLDRSSGLAVGRYSSYQHQVFGHFSGELILDDRKKIGLKREFGFAEKVVNHW